VTVNKDRVELFAAALESDGFKQCKGRLREEIFTEWPPKKVILGHCALGVATQVALDNGLYAEIVEKYGRQFSEGILRAMWTRGDLSPGVAEWYGWGGTNPYLGIDLGSGEEENIASANDAGVSFWDIAQAVRAKWLKDEG